MLSMSFPTLSPDLSSMDHATESIKLYYNLQQITATILNESIHWYADGRLLMGPDDDVRRASR